MRLKTDRGTIRSPSRRRRNGGGIFKFLRAYRNVIGYFVIIVIFLNWQMYTRAANKAELNKYESNSNYWKAQYEKLRSRTQEVLGDDDGGRVKEIDQLMRDLGEDEMTSDTSNDFESVLAQFDSESAREEVKTEFTFAFDKYEAYAWGDDILLPISKRGSSSEYKMGLTIVDSLDTCLIMKLGARCDRGIEWIRDNLSFNKQKVNIFEMTIRGLGGLLSAFHLSGKTVLKDKAKQLADKLMIGFQDGAVPRSDLDFGNNKAALPAWMKRGISTSEAGTLQLEFAEISRLTGDDRYRSAADKVQKMIVDAQRSQSPPLLRKYFSIDGNGFVGNEITLGARIDSTYEYYLKRAVQSRFKLPYLWDIYLESVKEVRKSLYHETPTKLLYIQELLHGKANLKMDHLVCFYPGMLALAVMSGRLDAEEERLQTEEAERIADTCYEAFYKSKLGLAAEIVKFHPEPYSTTTDSFSILRPEAVESWFYLWRLTKKQRFRNYAYEFLQNLKLNAKTPGGYASVQNVNDVKPKHRDSLESFFFAETLKYLYLIFSDDSVISLDSWVFNTEAHPLPIVVN